MIDFVLSTTVSQLAEAAAKRNLQALKPLILALYPMVSTSRATSACHISMPHQQATSAGEVRGVMWQFVWAHVCVGGEGSVGPHAVGASIQTAEQV